MEQKKYSRNRKCSICDRKHYARNYCRKHYNNLMDGRILEPAICRIEGCNKKVLKYIDEQLCCNHYYSYIRKLNNPDRGNGGEWGYKEYRKIRKHKKKYCEDCGKKKRGTAKFVLHHIDGNTRNSHTNNLTTLCTKCHGLRHRGAHRNSKFTRIYGYSVKKLAKLLGITISAVYGFHKLGFLKDKIALVEK